MDLTNELAKLSALHKSGALTAAEFAAAKARLIRGTLPPPGASTSDATLGRAANRYVSFAIIMSIIGLVAFLILAWAMFRTKPKATFRLDPKQIKFSAAPAEPGPLGVA